MDFYDLSEAIKDRLPSSVRIELTRASRIAYEYSPRRWLNKWSQRARRGWSVEDTFDFDGYLAKVIAGGVAEIRANLHGYPPELGMPDPEGDFDPNALDDERGSAEWASILDAIVEGFTLYSMDGYPLAGIEDDRSPPGQRMTAAEAKEITDKIKKAMALFSQWWPHLWD